MSKKIVNVQEIIGSDIAVRREDGEKVRNEIEKIINDEDSALISFKDIRCMTTSFLNSAIGFLYGEFDQETVKNHIDISDCEKNDLHTIKVVVDNAKKFYEKEKSLSGLTKEQRTDLEKQDIQNAIKKQTRGDLS